MLGRTASVSLRSVGMNYAMFGGFELANSAMMGERVSIGGAIARATPWVAMEAFVPQLIGPLIAATVGAGLAQALWETGRINVEMKRQFSMRAYANQLYVDTDAAATMRQRSVQVMYGTQMAIRSVMQNEGKIMHQRLNPY